MNLVAEVSSVAELPELIESQEHAVLLVTAGELESDQSNSLAALARLDLALVQLRPELVDPTALWFRIFAAPKLRRLGLPDDRVLRGLYLFEREWLLGWHPLTRHAAAWVGRLLERERDLPSSTSATRPSTLAGVGARVGPHA